MLQFLIYLSLAIFIAGLAIKIRKIIKMPVHLRWELYPVPHEKGKAHYGGSYFEEPDWWLKPRQKSFLNELKEMAREIFAIQTLFVNNKKLWLFSFPFHLGLYLLTAFIILLIIGAAIHSSGIIIDSLAYGPLIRLIHYATNISGSLGFILGAIGAAGLLFNRIFRAELRHYSSRADYFNLLLLLAIFISGIISWLYDSYSFAILRSFIQSLLFFNYAPAIQLPAKILIILTGIFLAYLPFTHMTHFVGKYFTYHTVRWQDTPNVSGSLSENSLAKSLASHPTWSAPHIAGGKTWSELTSNSNDSKDKPDTK